jgi:hypothetical protein
MPSEDIRPHPFFAILGGGTLLVHVAAVLRLLLSAITSEGHVDDERFVAQFFVTIALLGVGLLFLRLSRHKHLSEIVYSSLGIAYSLLGIGFFALGAFNSAVQFARGSLWRDRAAGLTFAGLFLGFAIGGLIFMAVSRRPEYRLLVYLFATIYVILGLIVVYEYVFLEAAVQQDTLADQLQLFIFGGLYLLGLYKAAGLGVSKEV